MGIGEIPTPFFHANKKKASPSAIIQSQKHEANLTNRKNLFL